MRWLILIVVALAACTSPSAPPPAPTPGPPRGAPSETAAPQLPAVEPAKPSLREFRARGEEVCVALARRQRAAPLQHDPLRDGASAADQRAAVAHYRARAAAFTAAADDLWAFGVPREKAGQRLITALDTIAQYSQQTAEFLRNGDLPTAQAAVAAVENSIRQADTIARRIGMTPLSECGLRRARLRGAAVEPVDATEFAFRVGDISAGPTRFVVRNAGAQRHHLFVVRLRAGGTLAEAIRADRAGGRPGQFLAGRGDVSPVAMPGGRATLDVNLKPGPYGLLCFVASPDGTPHAFKGMATEILVP